MLIEAWFDGVCEPANPGGHAAWGAVVRIDGVDLYRDGGYVGVGPRMSNNVAEYSGFLSAANYLNTWLEREQKLWPSCIVRGDSKLVIEQLNGRWNVNCTKCRKPIRSVAASATIKARIYCACGGEPTPGLYYPYHLEAVEELAKLRTRIKSVNLIWIPRDQNDICDVLSKQQLHDRGIVFKIQPEKPVRR